MDVKFDNVKGVRDFILEIVHYQTKLKTHKIDLNGKFIVGDALNCLLVELKGMPIRWITIPRWTCPELPSC
jgi:hypothetical protein